MYSKMWAASGVAYPELLDRLIALARERHTEKQQIRTSVAVRIAAASLLLTSLMAAPAGAAGLTSPEPLVKAYDLILEARFDEAERQLKSACPPAPQPACDVIGAVNDYWRLLLNPEDTSRDAALLARINAAIGSAEAWVAREPKRAEAWFYLGGAYGTRVLLRGHRGQYLAAARDGKRIHDSLQLAISLDPSLGDAYFGLGLYHYYAAIAPRAARILSMLMFLPGGDRAGGLKEMEQTRSKGMLLRGEADYQLHLIYLWYERQHDDGAAPHRRTAHALSDQPGLLPSARRRAGQLHSQPSGRAADVSIDARRRARGPHRGAAAVGGVRASRDGAGDGRALRQRRSGRAVERGHRAQAGGAVWRACARATINSASFTIARDVEPMRSRRISARAPRTRATIDCACARRFAQGSRARRRRARAASLNFFCFQSFFC